MQGLLMEQFFQLSHQILAEFEVKPVLSKHPLPQIGWHSAGSGRIASKKIHFQSHHKSSISNIIVCCGTQIKNIDSVQKLNYWYQYNMQNDIAGFLFNFNSILFAWALKRGGQIY